MRQNVINFLTNIQTFNIFFSKSQNVGSQTSIQIKNPTDHLQILTECHKLMSENVAKPVAVLDKEALFALTLQSVEGGGNFECNRKVLTKTAQSGQKKN